MALRATLSEATMATISAIIEALKNGVATAGAGVGLAAWQNAIIGNRINAEKTANSILNNFIISPLRFKFY